MWLCVRFEQLPLESLWLGLVDKPVAVSERQRITCCNLLAAQSGVRVGQRIATAYAMCEQLKLVERSNVREENALRHLAAKACIFSSQLSVWSPDKLLIEVGRSLTLFKGIEHLMSCLSATLVQEEFSHSMAIGPTPKAAEVFSFLSLKDSLCLWDETHRTFDKKKFRQLVERLDVELLPLAKDVKQKFSALGIKRVQQILALPEAVMSKRFGRSTQSYFRQLLGQEPDVQPGFKAPVKFEKTLEFMDVIHSREALLFPMRRLVDELIEFLRLHQKATHRLHWQLQDSYRVQTEFEVYLSDAYLQSSQCMELTRLRLESVVLTGPIERISLRAEQLTHLQVTEQSLLAHSEAFSDDLHFVNKIRARLGVESCVWLSKQNSVVPELANRVVNQCEESAGRYSTRGRHQAAEAIAERKENERPGWLLPVPQMIGYHPQKLYWDGKLTLVSQPERIEHQWWQKKVKRDYYVAQHASGVFYWVFYDHYKQRWFVQGVFA